MKALLFGSVTGIVSFVAQPICAQTTPAPSECQPLAAAIAEAEKELAWSQIAEEFETSAVRQTDADQKVANELQGIAINLSIANQLHCPPHRTPVSKSAYSSAARACAKALERDVQRGGLAGQTDLPPECDREKWQRRDK